MEGVSIDNIENLTPKQEAFDRIQAINEALSKNGYEVKDDITLAYERTFQKVLSFFLDQRHSKILYTLRQIRFSSFWEMYTVFQLGYVQKLQHIIGILQKYGIVDELQEDHQDFKIILAFWRKEYPNTRSNSNPKLFMISDSFKAAIDKFSPHIFRKYIWKSDYKNIVRRKESFERFYKAEAPRYQAMAELEKTKIGNCYNCNKIIPKGSKRAKDYHKYPVGLVCTHCDKTAPKETRRKWIHLSK